MKSSNGKLREKLVNGGIALLSLTTIALAIFVFVATGEASVLRDEKIVRAKKDFQEMIKDKNKILDLRGSLPKDSNFEIPDDPNDLINLIEKKAGENRIGKFPIKPAKGGRTEKGWRECSYTINIGGAKGEKVSRKDFLSFLLGLEVERPFLRTKTIHFIFNQDDIAKADVIISYFKREQTTPTEKK